MLISDFFEILQMADKMPQARSKWERRELTLPNEFELAIDLRMNICGKSVQFASLRILASAIVFCFVTFGGDHSAKGDDVVLRQRLESEAQSQWKELRKRLLALDVEVVDTFDRFDNESATESRAKAIVKYNGNGRNLRYESLHTEGVESGKEFVTCINPKYSFAAARNAADEPFQVRFVAAGENIDRVIGQLQNRSIALIGLMLEFIPIDALFAHSSFHATEVDGIEVDGQKLIRVVFESKFSPKPKLESQGGEVVLDPNLWWAVRRFSLRMKYADGDGISSGTTDYENTAQGIRPLRHVREVRDRPDSPVLARRVLEFVSVEPGDIDDELCAMSAFGIAEPGLADGESRSGWLLWLNVGAISCVVIAILLRYFANKNRNALAEK
jgi:hypothetical protein